MFVPKCVLDAGVVAYITLPDDDDPSVNAEIFDAEYADDSEFYNASDSASDNEFYNASAYDGDFAHAVDLTSTTPPRVLRTRVRRSPHEVALVTRMAMCGTWRYAIDPLTGRQKSFMLRCMRKDCPNCGALRGLSLEHRCARPDMVVAELPRATATAERRLLGSSNYINVPLANGNDLLFRLWESPQPPPPGYTPVLPHNFPWVELQNTPDGLNISGTLYRAQVATPKAAPAALYVPQIALLDSPEGAEVLAPTTVSDNLVLEATLTTLTLLPKTPQELQIALNQRAEAYGALLSARHITYDVIRVRRIVDMERVDWRAGILDALATLLRRDLLLAKEHALRVAHLLGERLSELSADLLNVLHGPPPLPTTP